MELQTDIAVTESVEKPKAERAPVARLVICRFRAGDTVRHKPTGAEWVLAVDQHGDHVSWSGWPEGMARAADCELVKRASDKERHAKLLSWANQTGNDHRIWHAKRILNIS